MVWLCRHSHFCDCAPKLITWWKLLQMPIYRLKISIQNKNIAIISIRLFVLICISTVKLPFGCVCVMVLQHHQAPWPVKLPCGYVSLLQHAWRRWSGALTLLRLHSLLRKIGEGGRGRVLGGSCNSECWGLTGHWTWAAKFQYRKIMSATPMQALWLLGQIWYEITVTTGSATEHDPWPWMLVRAFICSWQVIYPWPVDSGRSSWVSVYSLLWRQVGVWCTFANANGVMHLYGGVVCIVLDLS